MQFVSDMYLYVHRKHANLIHDYVSVGCLFSYKNVGIVAKAPLYHPLLQHHAQTELSCARIIDLDICPSWYISRGIFN